MAETGIGQGFGQDLAHEQRLTQQMVQSLNVLQAQNADLAAMIRAELEENPLLEEVPSEREGEEGEGPAEESLDPGADEADWERALDEGREEARLDAAGAPAGDEAPRREFAAEPDVEQALLAQLGEMGLGPEVRRRAGYLVGLLDERGWLVPGAPEPGAAPAAGAGWKGDVDAYAEGRIGFGELDAETQAAFRALRALDPPGLGGRNLRETLLLQADRRPSFPAAARKILEDHFDLLARRDIPKIAAALGVSNAEAESAASAVAQLDPHPGVALAPVSDRLCVVPDLSVRERDGKLVVRMAGGDLPKLRINRGYASILEAGSGASDEDRAFVRDRLNKARNFIAALERRGPTVERVVRAVAARQREFFLTGDRAKLVPMSQGEIADDVGLHLSTVNRAIRGRVVETEYGNVRLDSLFPSGVPQTGSADGEAASSEAFKSAIRALVEAEDRSNPLSDQKIASLLAAQGLRVARRTVAKYREQMGLLPAALRRRF